MKIKEWWKNLSRHWKVGIICGLLYLIWNLWMRISDNYYGIPHHINGEAGLFWGLVELPAIILAGFISEFIPSGSSREIYRFFQFTLVNNIFFEVGVSTAFIVAFVSLPVAIIKAVLKFFKKERK